MKTKLVGYLALAALVVGGAFFLISQNKGDQQASVFRGVDQLESQKFTNTAVGSISPKLTTTDPTVFLMGGVGNASTHQYFNDVWSSKNLVNWTLVSADNPNPGTAKWSQRGGQVALYFKNKLWVIGGQDANGDPSNEVWSSSDGATWNLTGQYGVILQARSDATAVVFKDKMWMMGGHTGVQLWNDVWSSSDGVTWNQTTSAGWSGRYGHASVVFNNKIWVMGGAIGMGTLANDVWSSSDGVHWNQVTSQATWSPRFGSSLQVYNNKMYLMGGETVSTNPVCCTYPSTNEVWSSTDGITWVPVPQNQWPAREFAASAVVGKKLYLFAGASGNNGPFHDIWSFDSSSWQLITSTPAWGSRSRESVVVPQ